MNPAEMDLSTLTDIAFIVILLLSGILAFMRGFVHEVLTIVAWVGAILVVVFGMPYLQPFVLQLLTTHVSLNNPLIASIVTGCALFLVALFVLSLLIRPIVSTVNKAALNGLDRALGFAFGLLRGFLLICLAFLIIWFLILGAKTSPSWLKNARSGPYIEYGIQFIYDLIPREWETPELNLDGVRLGTEGQDPYGTLIAPRPRYDTPVSPRPPAPAQPAPDTAPSPGTPEPAIPAAPAPSSPNPAENSSGTTGYSPAETQGMNRLFQQTNP